MINQELTWSVPLIFDHLARTHTDPEQKNFNNKGQRLKIENISIYVVVNHRNYCGDILSYSPLTGIFTFLPVNPLIWI